MARLPAVLKSALKAELFEHVGAQMEDKTVKRVSGWPGCAAGLETTKWIGIVTMTFNRIFAAAEATTKPGWSGKNWNSMIAERTATISDALEPMIKPIVRRNKLTKRFEWTVAGHFLQAWLLTEYPDAPAAEWSDRIMQWYLAGHVPCGYTGAVPAGKGTDAWRLPDPTKGKLLVF
jgi:hypothetical protein